MTTGKKIIWILVASFPFLGGVIYLLFGMRRGQKPVEED